MKTLPYKILICLLAWQLIIPFSLAQNSDDFNEDWGKLPKDWYMLPESLPASHPVSDRLKMDTSSLNMLSSAEKNFENIIEEQEKTLDGALRLSPRKNYPWKLALFSTQLALSLNGILGVFSGRGTIATDLIWRRKDLKTQRPISVPVLIPHVPVSPADAAAFPVVASATPALVKLDNHTSEKEFFAELDPAIETALKSGKIKNEKKFRANFHTKMKEFFTLFEGLDANPDETNWWINQFFFDVSVTAGGDVIPGFLGIDVVVRLSFEWCPIVSEKPTVAAKTNKTLKSTLPTAPTKMSLFVRTLSKDLEALAETRAPHPTYPLVAIRVRFGVSAAGSIFVARVGASASGAVQFSRVVHPVKLAAVEEKKNLADDLGETLLVDGTGDAREIAIAEKYGIKYTTEIESVEGQKAINKRFLYQLPRAALKRGLSRASRMASFFTRQALKSNSNRWELFRVAPSFALSLTGTIGVASISGNSSVMMLFDRQVVPR